VVWSITLYEGREALRVLAEALRIEDGKERSHEGYMETHLRIGKARGLSIELPDRKLGPCKGSNKD
jgi:hypothetical protein